MIATAAFFAGTAVSFFTLPVWVSFVISVSREGSRTDWLGFGGNIIAAAMTITAAVIGYFAIKRQLRIDLISREEDRVERQLPALRQTSEFMKTLAVQFVPDPNLVLAIMKRHDLIVEGTFTIDDLKQKLSDVELGTVRIVFAQLTRIMRRCERLARDQSSLDRLENEMINDLGTFPPELI
jgi:hypothetical protein